MTSRDRSEETSAANEGLPLWLTSRSGAIISSMAIHGDRLDTPRFEPRANSASAQLHLLGSDRRLGIIDVDPTDSLAGFQATYRTSTAPRASDPESAEWRVPSLTVSSSVRRRRRSGRH